MKKLLFPLLALLAVSACSPQVYSLMLDVRGPSTSGLDLSRKSLAIVTMETPDSTFDRNAASAMARVLEQDYFGGEELVGMYRVPAADSVSLDLMHSLIMDTDADVVFLLNSTIDLPDDKARLPLSTSLSVYDSMGEDKVHRFKGQAYMLPKDGTSDLSEEAEKVGNRIATRFLSTWKTESFSLYYFDDFNAGSWESALKLSYENKFAKAIDVWSKFVKGGTALKRAAASYNIAMAFYLLEDYEMASKWLDMADSLENLSLSPGLRKRITERLEK
ncbi:MAG: tetratricopeptide repeat protein [Bacteroidales bacterium]|nr:tetratricopeptide repeat protein [Bacteroidales bacterium]